MRFVVAGDKKEHGSGLFSLSLSLSTAVIFFLLTKIRMFAELDPGSALHLPLEHDDARIFLAAEEHGLESRGRGDAMDLDSGLTMEAVPIVSTPFPQGAYL
jgi:hypothetical protein